MIGLILGVAPAAAETECTLETWKTCPYVMFVEPAQPEALGLAAFVARADQIIDVSSYKTTQFLITEVPAGTTTKDWHYHEFDAVIAPVAGKARVWWIDRVTGEKGSEVLDRASYAYILIPQGVSHFVDLRGSDTSATVVEFLMSEGDWTREDFLNERVHIDEPVPPEIPFD